MREKVGKSRNTVFFQWFVAPEGRKVGSLKRRVRSQLARWEMKNCTPLWREAHFQVKMYKTPGSRSTFGSWDVEEVHAVGAKYICKSKCTKHLSVGPRLEVAMSKKCTPLWREAHFEVKTYKAHHSQKSARCCGAKHISKSKCTKHLSVGPLLEVEMSKKCTPLWREAHFEVKMYKTPHVRGTFGGSDVEKVHAVVARSTFRSQNVKSTRVSDHFWRFRCRFASLHCTTLHSTPLHCTALHYYTTLRNTTATTTQLHNYTPLHSTTLHYIPLHSTTLHYTPLHSTTLHYTKSHYTKSHYTTLHYTTLHYTPLHYTTLHYTTLHYTTFHYTSLHYTTLHSTTLHYITLHYLPLHFTTLHYTTLHYTTSTTTNAQLHSTTLHYSKLHYTTLHYTTLHYTTFHYTPLHYTTLHYTTLHWMTLHHR